MDMKKLEREFSRIQTPRPPEKILIVEDNPLSADLLAQTINAMGYDAVVARDGIAAIEMVLTEKPDLILLDIMVPGMDGYGVCRKLREEESTRRIPIVMITALSELGEKIKGIEVGADDFLTKPFNDTMLNARIRALLKTKFLNDQLETAEVVIQSLALSIEAKDPLTEGHCERLARYTALLAGHMGIPSEHVRALYRGSFLHDIGKIGIPDVILLKKGPLSEEEWEIMRQHPVIGEKICSPLPSLKLALPIIRYHHEKWNGSGYPDHLKGPQIPITARILQVVDIYDAMTTDRPYRPAMSMREACDTMLEECAKDWWDKDIVHEFLGLVKAGKVV